jgi:Protein of unknown function (DUF1579)
MPSLTDHHLRLASFAGRFVGRDNVAATQWGPGGFADAELTGALTLGNLWLALDHVQRRDGSALFEAHARMTWDTETSEYAMAWFDGFGFVPPSFARGQWTESGLTLVRSSPRGMARHTFRFADEDRLAIALDNSFDNGVTWLPVMTGDYQRA